ncbi:MAG: hypothetical protein NVS1B14_05880 [Vulcanimicrobiaceae bacterium]
METAAQVLDYGRLDSEATAAAQRFQNADPIRHVVLEDFLQPDVASPRLRAFASIPNCMAAACIRVRTEATWTFMRISIFIRSFNCIGA